MLTLKVLYDLDHMTWQNKGKKKASRKEKQLSSAEMQRQGSLTLCWELYAVLGFFLPK